MAISRRKLLVLALLSVAVAAAVASGAWYVTRPTIDNIRVGRFQGELLWKALDDGRQMELLAPYSYIDGQGEAWDVPKGAKVDGASIPQPLWSAIGGPFEGKYRNASVIHDHFCVTKTRNWEATHRVLYEAMLANGVEKKLAQLMFYTVYRFGPRWEFDFSLNHSGYGGPTEYFANFDQTELDRVAEAISKGDVPLSDLLEQAKEKRVQTDKPNRN